MLFEITLYIFTGRSKVLEINEICVSSDNGFRCPRQFYRCQLTTNTAETAPNRVVKNSSISCREVSVICSVWPNMRWDRQVHPKCLSPATNVR